MKIYSVMYEFSTVLGRQPRLIKTCILIFIDVSTLLFSIWIAYILRIGANIVPNRIQFLVMLLVPIISIPVFIQLGLYRSVIRYAGEYAVLAIFKSVFLSTILWTIIAYSLTDNSINGLPRSVPIIFLLVGFLSISFSRLIARFILWYPLRSKFKGGSVLILGVNQLSRRLAQSLREYSDLFPAGFLTDEKSLWQTDIDGLRVYDLYELPNLISNFSIAEVIICLPSTDRAKITDFVSYLENNDVKIRMFDSSVIASDYTLLNQSLRDIDISDLLIRDEVEADDQLLKQCVSNKVILVTGGGGSIGSELCRQILKLSPKTLVVIDASEKAIFDLERELINNTNFEVHCILGNVTDEKFVERLFSKYKIQTVYHAAAYKHVDLGERNIIEAIKNNIHGSVMILKFSVKFEVENFVLISSDKAVRPTNVMGATKRWSELLVKYYSDQIKLANKNTKLCSVRFGNVLGSSGSVVQIFKEQISKGGPVTVTDVNATRFFMTIREAVELVLQAGSLANDGDVFVLDMGEPVKVLSLAEHMINLSGYRIRGKKVFREGVEIIFTGLKKGEKLHEELYIYDKNAIATIHPKISRTKSTECDADFMAKGLLTLSIALESQDEEVIKRSLFYLLEQYDNVINIQ